MSTNTQEKDYFWYYVAGLVLAVVITVVVIKSNEHGKYESSAKAIAEDSANSAYRK
jgi:heme/copper-type cytochrome/quinol oxidase subunit 4